MILSRQIKYVFVKLKKKKYQEKSDMFFIKKRKKKKRFWKKTRSDLCKVKKMILFVKN